MRTFAAVPLVALFAVTGAAARAQNPVVFSFAHSSANPGERVVIRAEGLAPRRSLRLYLVPRSVRASVRSALDARLFYVGTLRSPRRTGSIAFTLSPVDSGAYSVWCAGCSRSRSTALAVTMPPATATACPVTTSSRRYGHDALSTTLLPGGVLARSPERNGSVSWKLGWVPSPRIAGAGELSLSGERIDAQSPPLRVLGVNWGYSSTGRGSWATAVEFPEPGCWRLRALMRVRSAGFAVDLSYVLKVVRG